MNQLETKIQTEGRIIDNRILKVDSFINQQLDPDIYREIGVRMAAQFAQSNVTRILTIEASGIAVALATAYELHCPVVFARKQKQSAFSEELYVTKIHSYTKNTDYHVTVSKEFLPAGESVLIVDDFLARGEASFGLARLVETSGSKVAGIGIVIEKSFQPGGRLLREAGYDLHSLVKIKAFTNNQVVFDD